MTGTREYRIGLDYVVTMVIVTSLLLIGLIFMGVVGGISLIEDDGIKDTIWPVYLFMLLIGGLFTLVSIILFFHYCTNGPKSMDYPNKETASYFRLAVYTFPLIIPGIVLIILGAFYCANYEDIPIPDILAPDPYVYTIEGATIDNNVSTIEGATIDNNVYTTLGSAITMLVFGVILLALFVSSLIFYCIKISSAGAISKVDSTRIEPGQGNTMSGDLGASAHGPY